MIYHRPDGTPFYDSDRGLIMPLAARYRMTRWQRAWRGLLAYLRGCWHLLCAGGLLLQVLARLGWLILTGWEADWKGQA